MISASEPRTVTPRRRPHRATSPRLVPRTVSVAATRIRALCKEIGLPYAELARRSGFTVQAVGGWFAGTSSPTPESCIRVARALGIDADALTRDGPDVLPLDEALRGRNAVRSYLESELGRDLNEEQREQLYRAAVWVPGRRGLFRMEEIHAVAAILRLRLSDDPTRARPANTQGARSKRPKRPAK